MLYFKNTELAEIHHVTLRTVLNWTQAAKDGKLDLTLYNHNGKTYIANTTHNGATIARLVEERRKYRNLKTVKTVEPRPEFFKTFNETQVYDIITNLQIHHEILREYNYFDGGAGYWDGYAQRLAKEEDANVLNSTVKLLSTNECYIDNILSKYKRVNIVDVGLGNALPVKKFLAHLLDKGVLGRYIGIDISPEMLTIARRNIQQWFGDKVQFEAHQMDINYERFANLLAREHLRKDADETITLVLVLGGTLCNLRRPNGAYKVIHDSMGVNDLMLHTQKLDTPASRRYFDFNLQPGHSTLSMNHRLIFDMLNIDESLYDVEMGYDDALRHRYIRVRLKVALNIQFKFGEGERLITFNKGDTILLWRSWQQTALDVIDQFDHNDFYLLHSSQTEDQEYMLTISRVKRD